MFKAILSPSFQKPMAAERTKLAHTKVPLQSSNKKIQLYHILSIHSRTPLATAEAWKDKKNILPQLIQPFVWLFFIPFSVFSPMVQRTDEFAFDAALREKTKLNTPNVVVPVQRSWTHWMPSATCPDRTRSVWATCEVPKSSTKPSSPSDRMWRFSYRSGSTSTGSRNCSRPTPTTNS